MNLFQRYEMAIQQNYNGGTFKKKINKISIISLHFMSNLFLLKTYKRDVIGCWLKFNSYQIVIGIICI